MRGSQKNRTTPIDLDQNSSYDHVVTVVSGLYLDSRRRPDDEALRRELRESTRRPCFSSSSNTFRFAPPCVVMTLVAIGDP